MAKSENVNQAITSVKAYLDEKEWRSTLAVETCTFKTSREQEQITENLYFRIVDDRAEFLFYIIPDITFPKEFHAEIVEFITRVNCGTRIGNFEFDYRQGKLLFKSSVAFTGDHLSLALVKAAVEPALVAWRDYFPGVVAVVSGVPPERAITKIDYGV